MALSSFLVREMLLQENHLEIAGPTVPVSLKEKGPNLNMAYIRLWQA